MIDAIVGLIILACFIWSVFYLIQVVSRTSIETNGDDDPVQVVTPEELVEEISRSSMVNVTKLVDEIDALLAPCEVHNPVLKSTGKWARKLRGQVTGKQVVDSPERHSLIHVTTPTGERTPIAIDTWLANRLLRYDHTQIKEALSTLTGFQVTFYKVIHPKTYRPRHRK